MLYQAIKSWLGPRIGHEFFLQHESYDRYKNILHAYLSHHQCFLAYDKKSQKQKFNRHSIQYNKPIFSKMYNFYFCLEPHSMSFGPNQPDYWIILLERWKVNVKVPHGEKWCAFHSCSRLLLRPILCGDRITFMEM